MVNFIDPIVKQGEAAQRSESVKTIQLVQLYKPLIDRSYEQPYNWYYLVFAPFNDTYDVNKYAICLSKTVDYLRKSKHVSVTISSREILSQKIHTNHLVCSDEDLYELLHGKSVTTRGLKYRVNVQCLDAYQNRLQVLHYIFKEANLRDYQIYTDHQSVENYIKFQTMPQIDACIRESSGESSDNSDDPDEPIKLTHRLY